MRLKGAILLACLSLTALLLGTTIGGRIVSHQVMVGCLFVQTFLAVSSLSKGWHRGKRNYLLAGKLFIINILAGSCIMFLFALMFGLKTPEGQGFAILAAVPVAAGLPVYAAVVGLNPSRIHIMCIISYVSSLIITPIILHELLLGNWIKSQMTLSLGFGLVLPTSLALLFTKITKRIPQKFSHWLMLTCVFIIILNVGGSLELLTRNSIRLNLSLLLLIGASLARAPLCGLIGMTLSKFGPLRTRPVEAALAGGYKNAALAATIGLVVGGPKAAIPGALGLISESILLILLAFLPVSYEETHLSVDS